MKFEVEVPDHWPQGKNWQAATLMKCEKCPYATPDASLFLAHVYQKHIMSEPEDNKTLTTAP